MDVQAKSFRIGTPDCSEYASPNWKLARLKFPEHCKLLKWCGEGDLNPHALSSASTSRYSFKRPDIPSPVLSMR
jgi:hypothetical protein